jgi:hypothetical protein
MSEFNPELIETPEDYITREMRELEKLRRIIERIESRLVFARNALVKAKADAAQLELNLDWWTPVTRACRELDWVRDDVTSVTEKMLEFEESQKGMSMWLARVSRERDAARMISEKLCAQVAGLRTAAGKGGVS